MGAAHERRRYYVTPPLIGLAHTQNDPCLQQTRAWCIAWHMMYRQVSNIRRAFVGY